MLGRIVIDGIRPTTPSRAFPAKAVAGEDVEVSADIFKDGHDLLDARVHWRRQGDDSWATAPLTLLGNDRWVGAARPEVLGRHEFVIEAWWDRWATWAHALEVKLGAGQQVDSELEEGARLLEVRASVVGDAAQARLRAAAATLRGATAGDADDVAAGVAPALAAEVRDLMVGPLFEVDATASPPVALWVDRPRAATGAWYELFPRSEGGLQGTMRHLPAVADMGFDVVYLPPIHPIGRGFRKGRGNTPHAGPDDPGSPWAIGAAEGGHTDIAAELGTVADFEALVARAASLGLEVALDYALQCSPDHPWVHQHPEWFHRRPDGSIHYAENPPKKYEDIYPINFWPDREADRRALWDECKRVLGVWIGRGVKVFRVDNPHTKPVAFWAWLIAAVQAEHPDVVFLAEAFTRPKIMAKLAEIGFSQSYTYFTWRTGATELGEYLLEVSEGPASDYMRPNFWPNTPDILSGSLRHGPLSAFRLRALLAATMSASWGMYSGFELGENEPASAANEEYAHSEKYEIKQRDWDRPDSLAPFVADLNRIRRAHPALLRQRGAGVHGADNDRLLVYSRTSARLDDVVLVVANLDPWQAQDGWLSLDLAALGLPTDAPIDAHDELTGHTFVWRGPHPWVRLDPAEQPAHVLSLRART